MDNNIYLIAQSIFYWLNYNKTVSKSNLLLESSVRFPLVECLERRLGALVKLEADHDKYEGLKIDFRYNLYGKNHYIELKFLHDYSNNSQEQKRYFDDLVRLAVLEGDNYFILCGSRKYLENRIKQYLPDVKDPRDMLKERKASATIYPEWFMFKDIDTIQHFSPANYWSYVGSKKHEGDEDRKIPDTLKEIETKLIAKQDDESKGSQVVYIWQVKGI